MIRRKAKKSIQNKYCLSSERIIFFIIHSEIAGKGINKSLKQILTFVVPKQLNTMGIKENLLEVRARIPGDVQLCAVSKKMPAEDILEAYGAGQKVFGENKAQELISKQPLLPLDIEWHFIGHLQSNKVKFIVPFIKLIHSVDSFHLLKEINKQSSKINKISNCLLQFHIASEESKFGLDMKEAVEILSSDEYRSMRNIKIVGVMGMASLTENEDLIKREFRELYRIFKEIKSSYFNADTGFKEISMGMSGDYLLAIQEGSTLVRVGTAIFGER